MRAAHVDELIRQDQFEQFWPTDTVHRAMARQKVFI
jgi:hypothetical protein